MKTAALAIASVLMLGAPALAQDQPHAHGADHGEHAHDAAHFATAMHAEHRLRETIAALQAGEPNYDAMTPQLAEAVRAQSDAMAPMLAAWGEIETLEHVAEPETGVHQFRVTFAEGEAATTWTISVDGEDRIQGLLLQ